MSARRFAVTGPRTLDDRILEELRIGSNASEQAKRGEMTAEEIVDVFFYRAPPRPTLPEVEAALGRLAEAGRVRVAQSNAVAASPVTRNDVLAVLRARPDGLESAGLALLLGERLGVVHPIVGTLDWIKRLDGEGLLERHVASCPGIFRLRAGSGS